MAFDAGFRHFDVAPLYGIGTAEDVLGVALAQRRPFVTIASKIGRPRPRLTLKTQVVRQLAMPLRRFAAPLLRWREHRRKTDEVFSSQFVPSVVQSSLLETLRRLRTDYLDLLLLHEPTLDDISDELLSFLDCKRKDGTVGAIGIASAPEDIAQIVAIHRSFFDVVQYHWCPLDGGEAEWPAGLFRIGHRAILRGYEPLRSWMASHPDTAHRLSSATDIDLTDRRLLANTLLGAAIAHNPDGVTLVASRRAHRILSNAEVMADANFVCAGRALIVALRKEPDLPAPSSD